jgi:hypothetical protein
MIETWHSRRALRVVRGQSNLMEESVTRRVFLGLAFKNHMFYHYKCQAVTIVQGKKKEAGEGIEIHPKA